MLEGLKQKYDDLYEWAKARHDMFIEIDHFEGELIEIMASYPRLVDTKKGKSDADPMVIALALSKNPTYTIITEEGFGSEKSPRIPYVCGQYDLRHINILQLLRDQSWTFP